MALGFRRSHEPLTPGFVADRIRSAYTLLESARIRCEEIGDVLDICGGGGISEIHRDLGLAGYHCSAEMEHPTRQSCLVKAHQICDLGVRDQVHVKLRRVFDETLAACDALSAVLATDPGEHVQVAHEHVIAALESLDSWLMATAD